MRESLDLREDVVGLGREERGCGVSGWREGISGPLVDNFCNLFFILFLYIDFNNKSYHLSIESKGWRTHPSIYDDDRERGSCCELKSAFPHRLSL